MTYGLKSSPCQAFSHQNLRAASTRGHCGEYESIYVLQMHMGYKVTGTDHMKGWGFLRVFYMLKWDLSV